MSRKKCNRCVGGSVVAMIICGFHFNSTCKTQYIVSQCICVTLKSQVKYVDISQNFRLFEAETVTFKKRLAGRELASVQYGRLLCPIC